MNPIFLIGATRSGTSWLQNMLGAHPALATPQELGLFSGFVAPWHEEWRRQLPESDDLWHRHRHKGIPAVLTEDAFERLLTDVAERIYAEILGRKPGATTVLEKEPGYAAYGTLLLRHFPEARILHLVRDGRDVAASLLRASRGWGGTWAAATVERAAWVWRTTVEHGLRLSAATPRYHEVRYEELRGDEGPAALARAFAFCGLEASAADCDAIYAACTLTAGGPRPASSIVWGGEVVRRLGGPPEEPDGFFGEGRPGAWRKALSPGARWTFHRVAGDLLVELGYEPDAAWVGARLPRRAAAAARLAVGRGARGTRFAAGAARRGLRRADYDAAAFPFSAREGS